MTDDLGEKMISSKDITNGVKKSPAKTTKKSPPKQAKLDAGNGMKKTLSNAAIDAKLDALLQAEKEGVKNGVVKEVQTSETGTNSDDLPTENGKAKEMEDIDLEKEAERIAIEKIDVVVKDAEERAAEILKNQEENGAIKRNDSDDALPSVCPYALQ